MIIYFRGKVCDELEEFMVEEDRNTFTLQVQFMVEDRNTFTLQVQFMVVEDRNTFTLQVQFMVEEDRNTFTLQVQFMILFDFIDVGVSDVVDVNLEELFNVNLDNDVVNIDEDVEHAQILMLNLLMLMLF